MTDITKTVIKDGWENEFFIIKAREGTTGLPQDIQCCVLQYHFTGTKRKRAVRLLKELGIETEFTDQNCCLTISSATGMKCATETVVKVVIDKLVPSLKFVKFDTKSTEAFKLLNFLKEKTPPDVKYGLVEVYYYTSTSTICVIGKEKQFTEFLTSVGLPFSTMQEKECAVQKTQMTTAHADIAPDQVTTGATAEKQTTSLNDKQNSHHGEFHKTEPLRQPGFAEFNCSKKEFVWLQDLNFLQYFYHMEVSKYVVINLTEFPGTITGDSHYVERVQAGAAAFLKRTVQEKVIFNHKLCQQLLITGVGAINQTVVQLLKDSVRCYSKTMKHTDTIAYSLNVLSTGDVTVTCRDVTSCSTVSKILSTCITHHTVGADFADSFSSHFKSDWKNKLKAIIEGKHLVIVCIKDIFQDVLAIIGKIVAVTKTLDLPPVIVEYLNTYGEKIISEASSAINAQIEVLPDVGLKIFGTDDQLKTLKSILKPAILALRRSVKVDVTEEEIQKCQVEIDDIANQLKCCWKMQSTKVFKQWHIQNCSYIAKWFDPRGTLQLTVVEGIAEDVNFDALVYMTNDSLYPHDECPGYEQYLIRRARKDYQTIVSSITLQHKNLRPGELYTYPEVPGIIRAKSVSSLVVLSARDAKKLSYKSLIKSISETLANLCKEHVTIAFKASELAQYMALEHMVQAICEGYKLFCTKPNAAKVIKIYLCCFKETVQNVTKLVNKCFKNVSGLGRKIFDDTKIGFQIHENKIKKVIELESILHANVDVIVNTVAKDLDLGQGFVSSQVLKSAGPDIQAECKNKCPRGIASGDIVTTMAYRIRGMRYVIHGAVAAYHSQMFQDHIKNFVKKCLYEAETITGCSTIAFPALGVGNLLNLEYPRRETASAMFDAFEEFQSEVIKPTITEIKLMLYSWDKQTCQAFCAEEWRRSKKCDKLPKPVIKQSVKYLKREVLDSEVVDVTIALTEDVKRNPYAVEVIFQQNSKEVVRFKNATEEPKTWNDQLYIEMKGKSASSYRSGMSKCLQYCDNDDRITEIIIDLSQVLMSKSQQLQIITEQIKQCGKQKYLRTVYLTVDDAGYADILGEDTNQVWKEIRIDPRNQRITIGLIGENATKLDQAETAIRYMLRKMKEKQKPVSPDLTQKESDGTHTDMNCEYGGARPKDNNVVAQVEATSQKTQNTSGQSSHAIEGFDEDDLSDFY